MKAALEKSWRMDSAQSFSVIYALATLRPTDMGRAFRHHRWQGSPNEGVQVPTLLPRLECVWAHGALSRAVDQL